MLTRKRKFEQAAVEAKRQRAFVVFSHCTDLVQYVLGWLEDKDSFRLLRSNKTWYPLRDRYRYKEMSSSRIANGIYRHYTGKKYHVLGQVIHTETQERLVLYRALYPSTRNPDSLPFVRPVAMFSGTVMYGGVPVPRFRRIE